MDTRKSGCATCRHEELPSECKPCCNCIDYDKWEAKDTGGRNCGNCKHMSLPPTAMPCVACKEGEGLEPSRWEQKGNNVIRAVDAAQDAPAKNKKLSYAIDGIRSHVSAIGLLLTDKGTDIDDLTEAIRQLEGLRLDWRELLREAEDEQHGNA